MRKSVKTALAVLLCVIVCATVVFAAETLPEINIGGTTAPVITVSTKDIQEGEHEKAVVTVDMAENPGVACLIFSLEYDERLTLTDKQYGNVFEEYGCRTNYFFNTLYGEDTERTGTILTLEFDYPEDTKADTDFNVKVIIRECVNADLDTFELGEINGGVKIVKKDIYKKTSDTPDFSYPSSDANAGYNPFKATTAAKLPSNRTVHIDGEMDNVWNFAECEQLNAAVDAKGRSTNSKTTGTFRTLWEQGSDGEYYLSIFATVDKGNVPVTDKDHVRIYFVLNDNPVEDIIKASCFGNGIYGVNTKGELSVSAGWHNQYGGNINNKIKYAAKVTGEYTYQVEMKFIISQSYRTDIYPDGVTAGHMMVLGVVACDDGSVRVGTGWTNVGYDGRKVGKLILGEELVPTTGLAGDINGDGKIKGNDATLLLKYLADWDVDITLVNSDCNGDGKIKGNDATLLLKYLADWNVTLG